MGRSGITRMALAGLAAALAAALATALAATFAAPAAAAGPRIVVTGHPLAAILREIAGDRAEIVNLVPPGASPHTFEPRPSDLAAVERATALFYVAPTLDGWAARLPAREKVEVLALVPRELRLPDLEEHAGERVTDDPHFWTDPLLVRAAAPALVAALSRLDPPGAAAYRRGGADFERRLERLHEDIARQLAPLRGRAVVLLHASFQYMLARYGLVLAAVVEPSPGKEPTVRDLQGIIRRMREQDVRAVFGEPQLPRRPVDVLAEAAGVRASVLDPLGGVEGRRTYAELIQYNVRALLEALR
jgi:zinc transport system substrate-binding protein